MNPDGTSLVVDPKDKGEASSEVKSFTSEDLERALPKQKEEHDASLEALVQMRIATLSTVLAPLSGGASSRPTVPTPSLGQQPPSNEHSSVPWLYARPQVEKPKYNPQGKPNFSWCRILWINHMVTILQDLQHLIVSISKMILHSNSPQGKI